MQLFLQFFLLSDLISRAAMQMDYGVSGRNIKNISSTQNQQILCVKENNTLKLAQLIFVLISGATSVKMQHFVKRENVNLVVM